MEATAQLGAAVERVLSDEDMRAAAQQLADEIASLPDVSEIVDSIERLAANH
jgi:UDP:flavonoid glycosyltransferase YjiC (YdhE family)